MPCILFMDSLGLHEWNRVMLSVAWYDFVLFIFRALGSYLLSERWLSVFFYLCSYLSAEWKAKKEGERDFTSRKNFRRINLWGKVSFQLLSITAIWAMS